MSGYTKLDNGIVTSSIWSADSDTRVVWITLLAMSDADGVVQSSIPGLARVANVSLGACEKSLNYLSSPDSYSRSAEYEGRRIKAIEGGWLILNRIKYAEKDYGRADYWKNWRNRRATGAQQSATGAQQRATQVKVKAEAEVKAEAQAEAKAEEKEKARAHQNPVTQEFEDEFWPNVPNKIGKGKARDAYIKARKKNPKETIMAGLPKYKDYEQGRMEQQDYRPLHPTTWLNEERWTDEVIHKETFSEQIDRVMREEAERKRIKQ